MVSRWNDLEMAWRIFKYYEKTFLFGKRNVFSLRKGPFFILKENKGFFFGKRQRNFKRIMQSQSNVSSGIISVVHCGQRPSKDEEILRVGKITRWYSMNYGKWRQNPQKIK